MSRKTIWVPMVPDDLATLKSILPKTTFKTMNDVAKAALAFYADLLCHIKANRRLIVRDNIGHKESELYVRRVTEQNVPAHHMLGMNIYLDQDAQEVIDFIRTEIGSTGDRFVASLIQNALAMYSQVISYTEQHFLLLSCAPTSAHIIIRVPGIKRYSETAMRVRTGRWSSGHPDTTNIPKEATMPKIDINALIRRTLEEKGCDISEEQGIWTVKAPDGTVWDFTTPTKIQDKEEEEK